MGSIHEVQGGVPVQIVLAGFQGKLFEAVVTPAVLYAAASWNMTQAMEDELKRTRRRMMRIICGTRRSPKETWVEHVQRATHVAEEQMQNLGYEDWVTTARRTKWNFIGKVVQKQDSRWAKRLLGWTPHFRCQPWRNVGHPRRRWEDPIIKTAGGDWIRTAKDSSTWTLLEPAFLEGLVT